MGLQSLAGTAARRVNLRAAPPQRIVLFDAPGSPCCRRVRITLHEKRVAFERRIVDLSRLEQKSPWFLALNPHGQVPTLLVDDRPLYESHVINAWLDELYPQPALYGDDADEYAEILRWQYFELSMSRYYGLLQYQRLLGPLLRLREDRGAAMAAARRHAKGVADLEWESRVYDGRVLSNADEAQAVSALDEHLNRLDAGLAGRNYLVGERLTQADIAVYPRVVMFPYLRLPLGRGRRPNLSRWMHQCARHESFELSRTATDRLLSQPLIPALLAVSGNPGRVGSVLRRVVRPALRLDPVRVEKQLLKLERPPRPVRALPATAAAPVDHQAPRIKRGALVLYGATDSVESTIVARLLELKGLSFRAAPVACEWAAEFRPGFRRLNPNGDVPVLRLGRHVAAGWPGIVEFVQRHWPDGWMPQDPWERAQARIWLIGDLAMAYKFKRPVLWQDVIAPRLLASAAWPQIEPKLRRNGADDGTVDWIRRACEARLVDQTQRAAHAELQRRRRDAVARRLRESRWLAGSAISLADLAEFLREREAMAHGWLDEGADRSVREWRTRVNARLGASV